MGWLRRIHRGNLTGLVHLTLLLLLVSQAFPGVMLFPHVPDWTTTSSGSSPLHNSENGIFYRLADLVPPKAPALKEPHKQARYQLSDRSVEGDWFEGKDSSNPALSPYGRMEEPAGRYASHSGLLRTLLCVYRL